MSAKKSKAEAEASSSSDGHRADSAAEPECFVIMPISDPEGYEPGHFMHVFADIFMPACKMAGFKAVRADQVRQTSLIHLEILQKIIDSPMAVCDLSSRNPNVLFELGVRQAFDKPVTLVQEIGTPSIFDIAPLRITPYRKELIFHEVVEDQMAIASAIAETARKDNKSINSIVKLLELTHGAKLKNLDDEDKEAGMLQLLTQLAGTQNEIMRRLQWVEHNQKPIPGTGSLSAEQRDSIIYPRPDRGWHDIRDGGRVRHATYGEGVARYIDFESIRVVFDDGREVTFTAKDGRYPELEKTV